MIKSDKNATSALTLAGFGCYLCSIGAIYWLSFEAGVALFSLGMLLILVSCFYYARAKGYSPWLGLLGLAFVAPGLLVIWLLPDRAKEPVTDSNPASSTTRSKVRMG